MPDKIQDITSDYYEKLGAAGSLLRKGRSQNTDLTKVKAGSQSGSSIASEAGSGLGAAASWTRGLDGAGDELVIGHPAPEDGKRLWELIGEIGTLERNTPYAYLLLTTFFRDTVLVAQRAGRLAGLAIGFIVPARPDTLFVWQIGVAPRMRGQGVALHLLRSLTQRCAARGVENVEATVTPDNAPSEALFRKLALTFAAEFRIHPGFGSHLFPGAGHEPERLVRIGPLPITAQQQEGGSLESR